MLKYVNFQIVVKLFTTSNLLPYFEKVNEALYRYLWIIVRFKQAVGLRLCFEPWCEACKLQGRTVSTHGNLDKSRSLQHPLVPDG